MYSVPFLVALALALLVFLLLLGLELDQRGGDGGEAPSIADWTPTFLPLFALGLGVLFYAIFLCVSTPCFGRRVRDASGRIRTWRGGAAPSSQVDGARPANNDDDNDDPVASAPTYTGVRVADGVAIGVVGLLLVGVVHALVIALNARDAAANPQSPRFGFLWTEVLFYALALTLGWLVVVGVLRTYSEHKFSVPGKCWLVSFGCCSPAYASAIDAGGAITQERNTRTAPWYRDAYRNRQPYQNNKVAYLLTPEMLPSPWLDGAHIVLLIVHALAVVATGALVFARLRQVDAAAAAAVRADLAAAAAVGGGGQTELLTSTALVATRRVVLGAWEHTWPVNLHHQIIESIASPNGRVLKLATVFIPLFVAQSLLLLLAALQAVYYAKVRRPFVDWVQGSAYVLTLAMLVLFEALLAVRVDNGTLAHASWHNTLAPLYTALLYTALMVGLSFFCAKPGRADGPQSLCGVLVE